MNKQLRIIYISLVQSIISYGIYIWGCTYDIHLNNLKITHNKLIRFILRLPSCTNIISIYNELKIFNIDRLFK